MLTLKLSHIDWRGAPYRWTYELNGVAVRAHGAESVGVSGPAYFMLETQEDVETRTGLIFEGNKLFEDAGTPGASVYMKLPFRDSTEYAIWKLNEIDGKLHPDFQIDRITFQSEPSDTIEAWIGGVRQVTALGEVMPGKGIRDVLSGADPRFAHLVGPGGGMEIHTWTGAGKNTIRKVIGVNLDNGEYRWMLVEKAWLLGSNGDTIQKICP
jgi:hypothetical protein